MARIVALVSLILILGMVNWSISKKEDHLAHGRIVYLELAPIDPRSLMQGDYMALRFRLGIEIYNDLPESKESQRRYFRDGASDGYVIVKLDDKKIATYKALYTGQAVAGDEILMRYRVRNDAVKFATDAFFFQEGHGKYYRTARYGQFRVDDEGELLLAALYDENLKKLEPPEGGPNE